MPEVSHGTVRQRSATTRPKAEPPRMYRVLLHNDNYTTMEFVVLVLQQVFHKPLQEAVRIMVNVHENGVGVCGVYPASIAETKVRKVRDRAQARGYPLLCTMEPEET